MSGTTSLAASDPTALGERARDTSGANYVGLARTNSGKMDISSTSSALTSTVKSATSSTPSSVRKTMARTPIHKTGTSATASTVQQENTEHEVSVKQAASSVSKSSTLTSSARKFPALPMPPSAAGAASAASAPNTTSTPRTTPAKINLHAPLSSASKTFSPASNATASSAARARTGGVAEHAPRGTVVRTLNFSNVREPSAASSTPTTSSGTTMTTSGFAVPASVAARRQSVDSARLSAAAARQQAIAEVSLDLTDPAPAPSPAPAPAPAPAPDSTSTVASVAGVAVKTNGCISRSVATAGGSTPSKTASAAKLAHGASSSSSSSSLSLSSSATASSAGSSSDAQPKKVLASKSAPKKYQFQQTLSDEAEQERSRAALRKRGQKMIQQQLKENFKQSRVVQQQQIQRALQSQIQSQLREQRELYQKLMEQQERQEELLARQLESKARLAELQSAKLKALEDEERAKAAARHLEREQHLQAMSPQLLRRKEIAARYTMFSSEGADGLACSDGSTPSSASTGPSASTLSSLLEAVTRGDAGASPQKSLLSPGRRRYSCLTTSNIRKNRKGAEEPSTSPLKSLVTANAASKSTQAAAETEECKQEVSVSVAETTSLPLASHAFAPSEAVKRNVCASLAQAIRERKSNKGLVAPGTAEDVENDIAAEIDNAASPVDSDGMKLIDMTFVSEVSLTAEDEALAREAQAEFAAMRELDDDELLSDDYVDVDAVQESHSLLEPIPAAPAAVAASGMSSTASQAALQTPATPANWCDDAASRQLYVVNESLSESLSEAGTPLVPHGVFTKCLTASQLAALTSVPFTPITTHAPVLSITESSSAAKKSVCASVADVEDEDDAAMDVFQTPAPAPLTTSATVKVKNASSTKATAAVRRSISTSASTSASTTASTPLTTSCSSKASPSMASQQQQQQQQQQQTRPGYFTSKSPSKHLHANGGDVRTPSNMRAVSEPRTPGRTMTPLRGRQTPSSPVTRGTSWYNTPPPSAVPVLMPPEEPTSCSMSTSSSASQALFQAAMTEPEIKTVCQDASTAATAAVVAEKDKPIGSQDVEEDGNSAPVMEHESMQENMARVLTRLIKARAEAPYTSPSKSWYSGTGAVAVPVDEPSERDHAYEHSMLTSTDSSSTSTSSLPLLLSSSPRTSRSGGISRVARAVGMGSSVAVWGAVYYALQTASTSSVASAVQMVASMVPVRVLTVPPSQVLSAARRAHLVIGALGVGYLAYATMKSLMATPAAAAEHEEQIHDESADGVSE